MSFYRLSRSASDDCEGKGYENERVFHGRIPSLTISPCPVLRRRAVTKITEFSFQTRHFVPVQDLPGCAFGAHGGELRQAAGIDAASGKVRVLWITPKIDQSLWRRGGTSAHGHSPQACGELSFKSP
jgi:hypothetical protein